MIEWPLVLLAGLLGSSHCIGMCGGFALAIGGGARSLRHNVLRQAVYTSGRLFTYAVLGAAVGFGGMRLASLVPGAVVLPALLAIAAGLLLLWQGLAATGWLPRRGLPPAATPCLAAPMFRTFLTSPDLGGVFLAGLLTGLLPCGLLYGMLALAASSRSMWLGMAAMVLFGLGTAPVMMLAGSGGSLLSLAGRRRLLHAAAWCVVLAGAVSIARGVAFLLPGADPQTACPFCP